MPHSLEQARLRPRLPLLVVDAMLPRQRVIFETEHARVNAHLQMLADEGEIGVVGVARTRGPCEPQEPWRFRGFTVRPMGHGVTAALACLGATWGGGSRWELLARSHMRVSGHPEEEDSRDGVAKAQVELIEDDASDADVELARALPPLVQEWLKFVRSRGSSRTVEKLQGILEDLGPMPQPEDADRLALWVAALVNPLPMLGVAHEIRPAILSAPDIAGRVQVAKDGIEGSIGHVSGRINLF